MAFGNRLSTTPLQLGCCLVAALLLPCSGISGVAEQPNDASPQVEFLQEVVVTARKRIENLQDTPISISVFNAADLQALSLDNLRDLASRVANLRSTVGPQGGSSSHYYIRGIGQMDFIASTDPGVGTYLDGIYLGRTTGAALDLIDVDQVEILRGPQGTLFGRNSIGGAINVTTATPPATLKRTVAIKAGSRNLYEGRLAIGGPLSAEELRGDVSVMAKSQDGWQRRLIDGKRFGDQRLFATRASLQWHPRTQLMVRATVDATRERGTADPHYLTAADPAHGGRPAYVVEDPNVTWAGQFSPNDLDAAGTSITIDYSLDRMSLKSISAYRTLRSDTGIDFDGTPFTDLDQLVGTRQSQWSQEMQFSGGAPDARLHWLAGVYYFGEHVRQAIPVILYGSLLSQNNDLHNESAAVFVHATCAFGSRWNVSAGARYSRESKRHFFNHFFDEGATTVPLFPPTTLRDNWGAITPKVGLDFKATPDLLLYASVSQGFRSGGFNGRPFGTDEFLAYDPETLTAYEVGLKSEWFERRLRLNSATFFSRYRDIQLTRAAIGAGGVPIVVTGNAGNAELYGMEIDLKAAATERLLITVNVGVLNARYTDLAPGATVHPSNRLPVSPRWTIASSIDYNHALGEIGRLRARIDYAYTSRFNYFVDNPPLSWEEAYSLWNGRIEFEPSDSSWQIAAFVLNAGNRRYSRFREDVRSSFGPAIVWPARPREWGLEVKRRF